MTHASSIARSRASARRDKLPSPHSSPPRKQVTLAALADGESSTYEFECPFCGRSDKASLSATRVGQSVRTKLWCFRCGDSDEGGRSMYAPALADELGVTIRELLDDPLGCLGARADRPQGKRGGLDHRDPEPLPPEHALWAYGRKLEGSRRLQRRLRWERGIAAPATREQFGIGWDPIREAWVLPVYDALGKLANVTWRPPKPPGWMIWKGSRVNHPMRLAARTPENGCLPLYPSVPSSRSWLLCEGEWDVIAARQAGLTMAVTGLLGKQWNSAWDANVPNRRIAVAYDCGAEDAAAVTVRRLLAAGAAESWVVPLGLYEVGDDLERWFRPTRYGGYGRTKDELLELIRKTKGNARREARR